MATVPPRGPAAAAQDGKGTSAGSVSIPVVPGKHWAWDGPKGLKNVTLSYFF